MATTIAPVQQDHISTCILIDLELDGITYYISSAYNPVTYNANTYTELGSFLQISEFPEDIRTTNGDISITLSGIPSEQNYLSLILTEPIKGGNVTVYRGFYDTPHAEIQTDQVYTRYKGVITNFSIQDDASRLEDRETVTMSIMTSSINTVLKNKIKGQRTNPTERTRLYSGDKIFDKVPDLYNTAFDFGREYSGGGGYGGGTGGGGGGGNNRRIRDVQER